MLDLAAGTRGHAHVTDVLFGRGAPEEALLDLVRGARGELEQEVHSYSYGLADAQLAAIERGAHLHLLASSRTHVPGTVAVFAEGRGYAAGSIDIAQYGEGAEDAYQHSKLAFSSRDATTGGPRAAFTNVSPIHVPATGGFGDVTGLAPAAAIDSHAREDVYVGLAGDTAHAAHDVIASARSGAPPAMGAAIDDAARAGLLVGDRLAQRSGLFDTMRDMVDNSSRRLLVLSKGLDDVDLARRVAAAHARGVPTLVVARELGDEAATVLEAAGVPTLLEPHSTMPSRMNVVLADDELLASTAYGWQRMLGTGADASPFGNGRESGVLLGPSDVPRALDSLRATDVGGTALSMLDELVARPTPKSIAGGLARRFGHGGGGHDAAHAVATLGAEQGYTSIDDARRSHRLLAHLT